jgi:hypothetical protein
MMNRSTFGPGVVTGFLLTVRLHLDLQRTAAMTCRF